MKLKCFRYCDNTWETKGIDLFSSNLFVGKNAVGKSKTIQSLSVLSGLFSQRISLKSNMPVSGAMTFTNDETNLDYRFYWDGHKVTLEELILYSGQNKVVVIDRQGGIAKLKDESINPPQDKLILNVRRDVILFPEIEEIVSWAERLEAFCFNEFDIDGDAKLYSRFISGGENLYDMVVSLMPFEGSIGKIVNMASSMGYHIEKIEPMMLGEFKKVAFYEKGVEQVMFDKNLSKGMFRTLYLLIYLEYISNLGRPATLLIDDLCEGLDYDRSTKLGKYVFDYCSKNDIQLIATSNDSFLMDVVDLNYWSILQREGSKVSAINHKNHPELFEDFSFTGLSNFDLLSSDFIARHKNK